jgi:hypothetical protein
MAIHVAMHNMRQRMGAGAILLPGPRRTRKIIIFSS